MVDAPRLAEVFIDLTVQHGPPQPSWLDCTSRLSRHVKVLVFSMLRPRHQANYDSIRLIVNRLVVQIGFCDRFICWEKTQVTIQSLSSLTDLSICYATSRCRYRLMHLGFSTQSTETQSWLPSPSLPGTTFELNCSYHLCAFYNEKPRGCAPNNNIYLWRFLCVAIGARLLGRGGCTKYMDV